MAVIKYFFRISFNLCWLFTSDLFRTHCFLNSLILLWSGTEHRFSTVIASFVNSGIYITLWIYLSFRMDDLCKRVVFMTFHPSCHNRCGFCTISLEIKYLFVSTSCLGIFPSLSKYKIWSEFGGPKNFLWYIVLFGQTILLRKLIRQASFFLFLNLIFLDVLG